MMLLNLIPRSLLLVLILALSAGLGKTLWDAHTTEAELVKVTDDLYTLRNSAKDSQVAAANAAAVNLQRLKEANDASKLREKKLQQELVDIKSASSGLRVSTAEARGVFQHNNPAQTTRDKLADLGYDILERCEVRYIAMAERAEEYAGYVEELRQAWPTEQACQAR